MEPQAVWKSPECEQDRVRPAGLRFMGEAFGPESPGSKTGAEKSNRSLMASSGNEKGASHLTVNIDRRQAEFRGRTTEMTRKAKHILNLAMACAIALPTLAFAQTAGQDMNNAGQDTKSAAQNTGHAVKKTTKHTYHKTKQATKIATASTKSGTAKAYDKTKEGTTVAANKTKETSVKAYDKSKEGVQRAFGDESQPKTKAKDQARESRMQAKDNLKQDKQKVQDSTPQ